MSNWLKSLIINNNGRARLQSNAEEAKSFIDTVVAHRTLPEVKVDLNLEKDERCFYQEPNVALAEERPIRLSKGMGGSVRVMRGVWVHSYGGQGKSIPQMQKLDTGELYITNKRIIFVGGMYNKSIKLKDILSTHQYTDAITISASNNSKNTAFYVGNSLLVKALMTLAPYGNNLKKYKNIEIKINLG